MAALLPSPAATVEASVIVARVNGQPVAAAELRRALEEISSQPVPEPPPAGPGGTRWDRALVAVVRIKVEQGLMQRYGFWGEIDYATFHRDWLAENVRRQTAREHGQPIYGPRQYPEEVYFRYVLHNARRRMLAADGPPEWQPSESELQASYEQRKAGDFRLGWRDDFWQIRVALPAGTPSDPSRRETTRRWLITALAALRNGASFTAVAAQCNDPAMPLHGSYTERDLLENKGEPDPFAQAVHRLQPGETSEVIDTATGCAVFRLLARDANTSIPLVECREQVRLDWVAARNEKRIARLVAAAQIELLQPAWTLVTAE